jgi:hypothetical protein
LDVIRKNPTMKKRVRKKTKSELAAPAFRKRATSQSEVLLRSQAECDKLSKSRHHFILDVASNDWMSRVPDLDDDSALEKESRNWARLRREFVRTVDKFREVHCFTCNYDSSRGMRPVLSLIKSQSCDAGTALRLFWLNDPVYYSQYQSISECPYDEEKEPMRLLRAIKQRFTKDDFKTRKIFFDPAPWSGADDVDLDALSLPESMLAPVP